MCTSASLCVFDVLRFFVSSVVWKCILIKVPAMSNRIRMSVFLRCKRSEILEKRRFFFLKDLKRRWIYFKCGKCWSERDLCVGTHCATETEYKESETKRRNDGNGNEHFYGIYFSILDLFYSFFSRISI